MRPLILLLALLLAGCTATTTITQPDGQTYEVVDMNIKVMKFFQDKIMEELDTDLWVFRMMTPEQKRQWYADRRREACEAFCPEI